MNTEDFEKILEGIVFSYYRLHDKAYFQIIRQADNFIEVKSLNTGHCWIIQRKEYCDENRYWLYHKHNFTDQYYHLHDKVVNVPRAVGRIRYHDFNTINRENRNKKKRQ